MVDSDISLSRQTTNSRIEDVLRTMILGGQIKPGERINEAELAERFGVSRGPLREAVQRLASYGLLEHIPHKGARVPVLDVAQVRELYEVRCALESFGAGLAAQRVTDDEVQQLFEEFSGIEQELADNPEAPYPVNRDLHRRIAELSGNRELAANIDRLTERINPYRWRSSFRASRAADAHDEHRAVITAIAARDPQRAEQEMRRHLFLALDMTSRAVADSANS